MLASGACKAWANEHNVGSRLESMTENLRIFPASCYVSDLDDINKMVTDRERQRAYTSFLNVIVQALSESDYEFVFIDNSPGLSLNGAMALNWTLRLAGDANLRRGLGASVWAWFITMASWWEQGLLEYEVNVYADSLAHVNPVLVVNRTSGGDWIGCFPPGESASARELVDEAAVEGVAGGVSADRLAELKSLFFHLPLWLGAERDPQTLLMDFVLPQRLRVAVIENVDHVARAASANDAGSDASVVDPMKVSPLDGGQRWARRAEEFFARFFLPSLLVSDKDDGPPADGPQRFHSQVWSALVKPMLQGTKAG